MKLSSKICVLRLKKLSNQNTVDIEYSVLIGFIIFQNGYKTNTQMFYERKVWYTCQTYSGNIQIVLQ
jgi:hypothetical protein